MSSDAVHERRVSLDSSLAAALRIRSSLSTRTSHWLAPAFGLSSVLVNEVVTLRGADELAVENLARNYRLLDDCVRKHGVHVFDSGEARALIPSVFEEEERYLHSLGYERHASGRWGFKVEASGDTQAILFHRLPWFISLASALRIRLASEHAHLWLHGHLWDDSMVIAEEIRNLEQPGPKGIHRDPFGLGTAEVLLPHPGSGGGGAPRSPFTRLLDQAGRTGDWRHANRAFELEGIFTRIRVDPQGRARPGLYWIEETSEPRCQPPSTPPAAGQRPDPDVSIE